MKTEEEEENIVDVKKDESLVDDPFRSSICPQVESSSTSYVCLCDVITCLFTLGIFQYHQRWQCIPIHDTTKTCAFAKQVKYP